jgi:hypothetical protein
MFTVKYFLAALAITVAVTIIQWFFIGFLFHKYQASTPATWRKEGSRSYALSTLVALFFSCMFLILFYLFVKGLEGKTGFFEGFVFSTVCWLAFSVTAEVGNAIYVNYSRMFVLGKCISSLVEYTLAGVLAVAVYR